MVNNRIVYQCVIKGLVGFESAKKRVFYTVIESILICGWEIWTLVYKLKGKNQVQTWISGEELQGLTAEEVKSSEKKWGQHNFGRSGEQYV
jgi:hypothetical protein